MEALEVEEGHWPVADLRAAKEAFLASTTREIQAVSSVDGESLSEAPGPQTREASVAFAAVLERELGESPTGS
jgi:branched-chain amino acid aminotransferase